MNERLKLKVGIIENMIQDTLVYNMFNDYRMCRCINIYLT